MHPNYSNRTVIYSLALLYCFLAADDLVTRGAGEPSTRLFVGNLSSFTTESSLMKAFDGCVEARIMVNPNTGKHMG